MAQEQKKNHMSQTGEAAFCIAYLIFDLIAAATLEILLRDMAESES